MRRNPNRYHNIDVSGETWRVIVRPSIGPDWTFLARRLSDDHKIEVRIPARQQVLFLPSELRSLLIEALAERGWL